MFANDRAGSNVEGIEVCLFRQARLSLVKAWYKGQATACPSNTQRVTRKGSFSSSCRMESWSWRKTCKQTVRAAVLSTNTTRLGQSNRVGPIVGW